MTSARFIIGDVREVLSTLPDGSVDLILTSPPFLALRSYLPPDHPDKHLEIGSEATPADFLDVLLDLTEEWARVLAPHGSICVELGDTYCGARGYGNPESQNPAYGDRSVERWEEARVERRFKRKDDGWPLDKSLCGIPTLYAWSLAYGRNLLRPERTTDPWRIRNLVAWVRPNPPVGALSDKFRPATSYMTIATKSRTRWFDLDAVRETPKSGEAGQVLADTREKIGYRGSQSGGHEDKPRSQTYREQPHLVSNPAGAPPLDWWEIPTEPYKGSHYATWPRRLLERPILAMCPLRVCTVCGEPSRRIAETTNAIGEAVGRRSWRHDTEGKHSGEITRSISSAPTAERRTLGWTDCGCSTDGSHWRNGVVLDPFAGTGTTLAVATGHGRDAIGIDIDERNADLALERIGPLLLTVERHNREAA